MSAASAQKYFLAAVQVYRPRAFPVVVRQVFNDLLRDHLGALQPHLLGVLLQICSSLPIRLLVPALGREMLQVGYQIVIIMLEKSFVAD